MKTAKTIIGIVSIVLSLFITFQSIIAGLGNALTENGEVSGSAGIFLSISMLVAGIIALATRKGIAGGYVAGGFFALGGIIGISNYGSYSDLLIWSILALIFAAVFIIGSILTKRNNIKDTVNNKNNESKEASAE